MQTVKFKIKLLHFGRCIAARLVLSFPQQLCLFYIGTAERTQLVYRQQAVYSCCCSALRSVYWSSCVFSLCTSLNWVMNCALAASPRRLYTSSGLQSNPCDCIKLSSLSIASLYLPITTGAGSTSHISFGLVCISTREKFYSRIYSILLAAEVQYITIGLGIVQHTVGARKSLYQPVVFQVLIYIQGIQVFRVEGR